MDDNIKYVLIGNLRNSKEIAEYPSNSKTKLAVGCKDIFEKLVKQKTKKFEERYSIAYENDKIHFICYPSETIYMIGAGQHYAQRDVFDLIKDFHETHTLYLKVNEKGELSEPGKRIMSDLIKKKQNSETAIKTAQLKVDEVKVELKNNIIKVVDNLEEIENLDQKAKRIEQHADDLRKNAVKLNCCTWLRKVKWILIIVAIVIAVLIVIIVPIVVEVQKNQAANGSTTINNSTTIISPAPSPPARLFY